MDQDRISELPEHIFQHILSLLTQKEAAQTCVLSKSCRYLWSARPNVEFREDDFRENGQKFAHVVDRTLQGYMDRNLRVHKFCVEVNDFGNFPLLGKWVPIVACALGIHTLELKACPQFQLPSKFFEARSLRNLHLENCRWGPRRRLRKSWLLFKHLRTLRLDSVIVEDGDFENIMWSCPLIEHVVLKECVGLRSIDYVNDRNFNLNHFEFDHGFLAPGAQGVNIKIYTPSIATIIVKWCDPELTFLYPNLKSLHLGDVRIPEFDCFSTNFPCLEELILDACFGFEQVKLSSVSIKHLRIYIGKKQSFKAVIDAPKLVEFECVGAVTPSVSFATTPTNKWRSYVRMVVFVDDDFDASSWLLEMSELLAGLSQSEITLHLQLVSCYGEAADIPARLVPDHRGFCKKPAVAMEHLSLGSLGLGSLYSASSFPHFIDALFRIARPRKLGSHQWYPDAQDEFEIQHNQVTKSLFKILQIWEKDECRDTMISGSWQQHLEEVILQVLDENEAAGE